MCFTGLRCELRNCAGLHITVAINFSARLLDDDNLTDRFSLLLKKYGISASMVTIELTETALATNPEKSRLILNALAALGAKISIDDFGAGYTSLRYLREFDIAEIKIDGMFVSGLLHGSKDEAIIRSVVALGRNFDVPIVAEGIEDVACLAHLTDLGCTYGQGFQICYPLPASEIPAWWNARNAATNPGRIISALS